MTKIEAKIPFLSGSVLGFGIKEEKILKAIEKNKKIIACDLIDSISLSKDKKNGSSMRLSYHKLRKRYCNKKVDFIIVNENEMNLLEKKLLSFYIDACSNSIYIYGDYQLEKIRKRFKRYNASIKEDDSVLVIDTSLSKHNKLKDPFYYVFDLLNDLIDLITDFLVS